MSLSTSQLATFKAAILAEPALVSARAAGDHGSIAAYYNASAGSGSVWRPDIRGSELHTAVVWSEFSTVSLQLQGCYLAMTQAGSIDATSANIRAGFLTVFGAGTTSRANLTALAARIPTRFEALFTTSNVSTVFGQIVTVSDVAAALGS